MDSLILIKLLFIILFLLLCAFFSGSEVALFSLGSLRLQKLKEENHPSSATIERLLENPRRLLISILIANEIGNIAASSIATPLFITFLGERGEWIAVLAMTLTIIFLCDIVPKSLCINYPDKVSPVIARPMLKFVHIISPLRWSVNHLVDGVMSLLNIKRNPKENIYMEEEFRDLVDLGHREGSLDGTEKDLIHRVFRLSDTRVSRIMTPRKEMFMLPLELGFDKLISLVKEGHYSRIPVYSKDRNNIVGILNSKDLLPFLQGAEKRNFNATNILRKPFFISQDKRIDELLRELQHKKIHMAIVRNEQNIVNGLVTLEDILEEIFGEIYDEYDR